VLSRPSGREPVVIVKNWQAPVFAPTGEENVMDTVELETGVHAPVNTPSPAAPSGRTPSSNKNLPLQIENHHNWQMCATP
jgi:hypothetical protein